MLWEILSQLQDMILAQKSIAEVIIVEDDCKSFEKWGDSDAICIIQTLTAFSPTLVFF